MKVWARIVVTLILMVSVSFIAGLLWGRMFNHTIPSYISGLVGGMVAIPVWELMKKFKPKKEM
jgi:uncharacterized membrane protein